MEILGIVVVLLLLAGLALLRERAPPDEYSPESYLLPEEVDPRCPRCGARLRWTHERGDGGPDRRRKHNPRICPACD